MIMSWGSVMLRPTYWLLVRYSIMGAYLMEPEKLSKVKPASYLRFAGAYRRFIFQK